MRRIALIVIVGVAIGIGELALAQHDAHPKANGEDVKVVATYDLKEKLDGKDADVTMVEVELVVPWIGHVSSLPWARPNADDGPPSPIRSGDRGGRIDASFEH